MKNNIKQFSYFVSVRGLMLLTCFALLFSCSSDVEERPIPKTTANTSGTDTEKKHEEAGSLSTGLIGNDFDEVPEGLRNVTLEISKVQDVAKTLFQQTTINTENGAYPYGDAVELLEEHLEYAVTNDIYVLFDAYGYREALVDAMYDYCEGVSFYDIVEKHKIKQGEMQLLANTFACIDYMSANSNLTKTNCMLAVAASVVTTVSAIGITTPAGLGIWLVSKSLATYFIATCAKR